MKRSCGGEPSSVTSARRRARSSEQSSRNFVSICSYIGTKKSDIFVSDIRTHVIVVDEVMGPRRVSSRVWRLCAVAQSKLVPICSYIATQKSKANDAHRFTRILADGQAARHTNRPGHTSAAMQLLRSSSLETGADVRRLIISPFLSILYFSFENRVS
jgi:hypothetical protein